MHVMYYGSRDLSKRLRVLMRFTKCEIYSQLTGFGSSTFLYLTGFVVACFFERLFDLFFFSLGCDGIYYEKY